MDADEKKSDIIKPGEQTPKDSAGFKSAPEAAPAPKPEAASLPEARPATAQAKPEAPSVKPATPSAPQLTVLPAAASSAEPVKTRPAAAETPVKPVPSITPVHVTPPTPAALHASAEDDQQKVPHRTNEDLEVFTDEEAERLIRAKSRRSFLWGAAAVAGAWAGIGWLGTRHFDKSIAWPFRRLLEVNENLSRDFFSSARLAPEFPKDAARMPRANGDYGVASEIDPDWKLHLVGLADMSAAEMPDTAEADTSSDSGDAASDTPPAQADKKGGPSAQIDKKGGKPAQPDKKGGKPPTVDTDSASASSDTSDASGSAPADTEAAVMVSLQDIKALPRAEIVTELKCIEGWSTVVHWAGARLVDFMRKYPPATKSGRPFDPNHLDDLPEYVSMLTPDGAYFVGLDMASALHPQTLLCYEMNGKPLTAEHGAPLRLAIPVKYGIKNIKNIGKIKFTDERPKDYWAELGYDWYAGH